MENDDPLFCTQCGATLKGSATFCQECGTPVGGVAAEETRNRKGGGDNNKGKLLITMAMFLVLAVFALYMGAYFVMESSTVVTEMMKDPSIAQMVTDAGLTSDQLVSTLNTLGYFMLAVGVLAVVNAVLVYKRMRWMITIVLTVVLTALMFWTVIGIVLGILAFYFQYSSRDEFSN